MRHAIRIHGGKNQGKQLDIVHRIYVPVESNRAPRFLFIPTGLRKRG